jgi:hypothetical protein
MALDYSLHQNVLVKGKDEYAAYTHVKKTHDEESLIAYMLSLGTTVTRTDIVAVFDLEERAVSSLTDEGESIHRPLYHTSFSITGKFDSMTDTFDPARHHLNVKINDGSLLLTAEKSVKLTKVVPAQHLPLILEVRDSKSKKIDEILTSGGVVELLGSNIKIDGDDPSIGLYFVPTTGAELKSETIVTNKPSSVIATIPALAPGTYKIRLSTQFSGGKTVKDVRTTTYGKVLLVS